MNERDKRCKCTLAQSLTGDGCRYCQPQKYIDILDNTMDYDRNEHAEERREATDHLDDALTTVCTLCRRLNPQHKDCNSCLETDEWRGFLAKHKGESDGTRG